MTDKIPQELVFQAGINKNTTDLDAEGTWVDCDKIRFRYGKPQKLGGWIDNGLTHNESTSPDINNSVTGITRIMKSWGTNDASHEYTATASEHKVEIIENNKVYDITPIRVPAVTLSSKLSSVDGTSTVKITYTASAVQEHDFIILDNHSSTIGGLSLSGQYQVSEIIDANSFMIDTGIDATSTQTDAGGDIDVTLLLDSGEASNGTAFGWGAGPYSREGYGEPALSGSGLKVKLREWSLENWGEDLLFNPKGGKIYHWDATNTVSSSEVDRSDVRAVEITGAPDVNNHILMTPDRHLIAFGTKDLNGDFDPLLIRWSTQENYNIWDPTTEVLNGNSSGEKKVQGGTEIITAVNTDSETIIFTDSLIHTMRYIGAPFYFAFDAKESNAGIVGKYALSNVGGTLRWMGNNGFYQYSGGKVEKMPCSLTGFIFDSDNNKGDNSGFNVKQKEKVVAGVNTSFNEIVWFYPSKDSEENNRYVIYNYLEGLWYDGSIERTAWQDTRTGYKPQGITPDGHLFTHEEGNNDGNNPMDCYIQSAYIDIVEGQTLLFSNKFIPDVKDLPNNKYLEVTLESKKYPQSDVSVIKGPLRVNYNTEKLNYRIRGRQIRIKYATSLDENYFRLGAPRLLIRPDSGER